MHTGVGRFGHIEMGTMTLQELGISSAKLSLSTLIRQAKTKNFEKVYIGELDAKGISEILVRGGWPGVINLSLSQAKRTAKDYVDAICEIDISSIDNIKRDPQKVRATIRSLARNESSYASINTLEKDVGISISRQTISEYLGLLSRLHVCKAILPWNPALRSPVKIRAAKNDILQILHWQFQQEIDHP